MIVNAIYRGSQQVHRVYHGGEIIFERSPVEFHVIEDGKLIILGAMSANSHADGLYLDCEHDWTYFDQSKKMLTVERVYSAMQNGNVLYLDCEPDWIYPEQNGNVLTIEQVYSTTQTGNVLEVE